MVHYSITYFKLLTIFQPYWYCKPLLPFLCGVDAATGFECELPFIVVYNHLLVLKVKYATNEFDKPYCSSSLLKCY